MHIKKMAERIYNYEKDMEIWRENTPFDNSIYFKLCLIHSHITECFNNIKSEDRQKLGEKLADAILSISYLAEGLNINIEDEIEKKYQSLITCVPFTDNSKVRGNYES